MLHKTFVLDPQNVGLYTLEGGGRGSEKVYCLYTHENVDILGWPLNDINKTTFNTWTYDIK